MFILSKKKLKLIKNPLNDKIKINKLHNLIKKIKESIDFTLKNLKKYYSVSLFFLLFYNIRFNLSLLKNFIFINFINLFKKKSKSMKFFFH